jgi:hypothetical protein
MSCSKTQCVVLAKMFTGAKFTCTNPMPFHPRDALREARWRGPNRQYEFRVLASFVETYSRDRAVLIGLELRPPISRAYPRIRCPRVGPLGQREYVVPPPPMQQLS